MSDFTQVLERAQNGDSQAAEELLPIVYQELRKLAAQKMAQEAPGNTLQPTALLHEAWLRLTGGAEARFANRAHFFFAAAEAMRRILIDRARSKSSVKHGGEYQRVDLDHVTVALEDADETVLAVNDALERLAAIDPKKAEVVKLRYFGGMNHEEIAAALALSEPTVRRYWSFARAWLYAELKTFHRT